MDPCSPATVTRVDRLPLTLPLIADYHCSQVEDFGMKLAHQFPWAPAAAVAVGLALRRRFLSDPDTPSTVTRRLQVTKVRCHFR